MFFLPALVGVAAIVVVTGAYRLSRLLDHSLPMQAGAARMPEGAAHEFA